MAEVRRSVRRHVREVSLESTFFVLLFLLAFYYLSYRYPFQINASTTSPTYRDTPTSLQVGKYLVYGVLIGGFAALRLIGGGARRIEWRLAGTALLCLHLFVYALAAGVLARNSQLAETGIFFTLVPCYVLLRQGRVSLSRVASVVRWMVYIGIAVSALQVAAFLAFGRLPALAYAGSLTVRFGSVWDDPNGWAIFTSLLAGFVVADRTGKVQKAILLSLLGLSLLLTQSLTGIAATLGSVGVVLLLLIAARARWRWIAQAGGAGAVYAVLGALVLLIVVPNPLFQAYWREKSGSVAVHVEHLQRIARAGVGEFSGFAPIGEYGEPGYLNLAVNMGVPYLLVFVYVGLVAMIRHARQIATAAIPSSRAVNYACLAFLASYYLAMVNLPVDTVFPLNLIMVLCILLSFSELTEVAESAVRRIDVSGAKVS